MLYYRQAYKLSQCKAVTTIKYKASGFRDKQNTGTTSCYLTSYTQLKLTIPAYYLLFNFAHSSAFEFQ